MLHHRTVDPAVRASHIADREERLADYSVMWPETWLREYRAALPLLVEPSECGSGELRLDSSEDSCLEFRFT